MIYQINQVFQHKSMWNSTTGMGILNKPNLATVATSGSYNDLSNKPSIPAAQVQSNWNATTGMGVILNKPSVIIEGDSRLTNARPASDVSAWAKKSSLALSDVPTISIAKGGTGATTALAARANLGLGNGATASNVIRQSNSFQNNKILTIEVV